MSFLEIERLATKSRWSPIRAVLDRLPMDASGDSHSCGAEVQPPGTTTVPNTAVWNYLRQTPLRDGDAQ